MRSTGNPRRCAISRNWSESLSPRCLHLFAPAWILITSVLAHLASAPVNYTPQFEWYFVSTVLQFQIFRGLCRAAVKQAHLNPSDPLYKCDVYRSSAAGNVLANLMSRGSSQPWQEVLQESIGESRLDGGALRDFFAPLEEWLRNENLRTGETVGWLYDGDYCKHSIETANLQVLGGFYNSAPKNKPFALAIFLLFVVKFIS